MQGLQAKSATVCFVWFLFEKKKKNQISQEAQIFLKAHTPVWQLCLQLSTDYFSNSHPVALFTLPPLNQGQESGIIY